jgi:hypothetical protein
MVSGSGFRDVVSGSEPLRYLGKGTLMRQQVGIWFVLAVERVGIIVNHLVTALAQEKRVVDGVPLGGAKLQIRARAPSP